MKESGFFKLGLKIHKLKLFVNKEQFKIIFEKLRVYEVVLFYVLVLVNLYPICAGRFFPTLDGPAHLYNSQLINSVLFGKVEVIKDTFTINSILVPNWSGHFILAFFNLFFKTYISEKLLIIFILMALPISFRLFLKQINPKNLVFSYFIFPFTYSMFLCMGFYNFILGIVFMFFGLAYWLKERQNLMSLKVIVNLFLFFIIIYFSHLIVFLVFLFILITTLLFETVVNCLTVENIKSEIVRLFKVKLFPFLISAFIPLMLMLFYFRVNSGSGNKYYINIDELLKQLWRLQPIISYSEARESEITIKITYIFLILIVVAFIKMMWGLKWTFFSAPKKPLKLNRNGLFNIYWVLASIGLFGLFLIMPDHDDSAGFISLRIAYLFFFFLIASLSLLNYHKLILFILIPTFLFFHFCLNAYYFQSIKQLNQLADECYNMGKHIKNGSVVLPVNNFNDRWLSGHYQNYVGLDKPILMLDNYECELGYFPIVWKNESMPYFTLGHSNAQQSNCLKWKSNSTNAQVLIKYVMILGDIENDTCRLRLWNSIKSDYALKKESNNIHLFELTKD